MEITLHAIALLAIPALTVVALCLLKLSPPTPRRLLYGMIPCLFVLLATAGCNHLCREGQDYFQWLIPVPFLYVVLLFVHSVRWRALLASGIALACVVLSSHFDSVVHEPGWTGNPAYDGMASYWLRAVRREAARLANDEPNLAFEANWLRDLPIAPRVPALAAHDVPSRRAIGHAWHTAFTGLFPYVGMPQDFWYPGGLLSEAASRIELRDRPHDPSVLDTRAALVNPQP